jgi:hypothetical protein
MMRVLIFAGTIALAMLPPATTLSAPTPVVRAASGAQLPPPRAAEVRRDGQDSFKLPIHFDARPKPLEPNPSYTWYQSAQRYQPASLYQPAQYQNGCFANNLSGVPSTAQSDTAALQTVTLGSLADDRSKALFSSTPSYKPDLSLNSNAPATSSGLGFQYQVQQTPCGQANVFNF